MSATSQISMFDRFGNAIMRAESDQAVAPAEPQREHKRPVPLVAKDYRNTSRIAAQRAQDSDRQKSLSRRVLDFMTAYAAPLTFHEVAQKIGEEDHAVMKRLNQLRHEKRVEHAPKRVCSITGSLCVGWRAIDGASSNPPTLVRREECRQDLGDRQKPSSATAATTCSHLECPGGIPIPGLNPAMHGWHDELTGKTCSAAERMRAVNPDANSPIWDVHTPAPSDLENLAR